MRESIALAACPAVHLLVGSRNPDCIHAQTVEIVEFLGQTLDVASVEGGVVGHIALRALAVV